MGICLRGLSPALAGVFRDRRGSRRFQAVPLAAALALSSAISDVTPVFAQESSSDIPTSISPPQLPTEVAVGAYLIGLSGVSEPSDPFPTVELEVFLNLSWLDARLAFGDESAPPHVFQGEEAREKLSEIWSPDIEIENEVEQRQTESVELTVFSDGRIDYEERFGATLNAEMDLHEFPFDRQSLDMELQSFVWDQSEVAFVANEAQTGFDPDFETPEWNVHSVEMLIGVRSEVRDEREFSSYTLRVNARRDPGHYLIRFMMPLFFVMTLTWFAFWEPVRDRFRVGFLALLTVVATHAIISDSLPRLDYPTIADMALIVCYLAATAIIVVSIVVRKVEAKGDVERAQRIDRWARWLFPGAATLILAITVLVLWN